MKVNGQQAWLKLPIIGQFQPSEFVKIPVVLMLAKYFGGRKAKVLSLKEIIIGFVILAVPVGLIMLEPDAGQAMTYFPILAVVLFLSGIKIRYVVLTIVGDSGFIARGIYSRCQDRQNQTLSAGAHQRYFRPGKRRPARLRLSHGAVDDYGRQRRLDRHQEAIPKLRRAR